MSAINGQTNVYLWTYHPPNSGQRVWVAGTDTVQNRLGEKILNPILDTDPHAAESFRYDIAIIAKRRFESEGCIDPFLYSFHCSLTATGEEVAAGNTTSAPDKDNRVVMHYKGVTVRPYIPRGWCVHLYDGPRQLESVKGDTIEEAVDKVIDRGQLKFAEKFEQQQPESKVVPSAPKKSFNGRIRPGSMYEG
jgi:hypothetical protein